MRRGFAVLLCVMLTSIMVISPMGNVIAYAADHEKEVIQIIGIMDTDKGSNTNGKELVTRARFSQMLINLSSLKDR